MLLLFVLQLQSFFNLSITCMLCFNHSILVMVVPNTQVALVVIYDPKIRTFLPHWWMVIVGRLFNNAGKCLN